jgi:anti-sigma factor ChrR (cupin superfamily)
MTTRPGTLNHDFSQRVVLHTADLPWLASPMAGVERRMLDRIGGEVARATSIVRYAPGSRFSRHVHGGGEEYLVLEGVFSDEHGHNPPGTYVRNPPGSGHAPYSEKGCTIVVKLWQFAATDTQPVRIDTRAADWRPGLVEGLSVLSLHEHDGVSTALVRWVPHMRFHPHRHPGGEEILVLEGSLHDEEGDYPALTWLRNPRGSVHTPWAGPEGALIYVKVGHIGARWMELP